MTLETKPLNKLAKDIHKIAKSKGFYDNPREIGTLLMLIVSEISEAMEADRKGKYANMNSEIFHMLEFEKRSNMPYCNTKDARAGFKKNFEFCIKDTFEDELADTVIRLLDLCAFLEIDIDWHISAKMKYNTTTRKLKREDQRSSEKAQWKI